MVRAGVVDHPSGWPFSGYNEIQEPRRKNVLIDYEKLRALLGFENYDQVKLYHKKWIDEYLGNDSILRFFSYKLCHGVQAGQILMSRPGIRNNPSIPRQHGLLSFCMPSNKDR